jgi:hypothetical protein
MGLRKNTCQGTIERFSMKDRVPHSSLVLARVDARRYSRSAERKRQINTSSFFAKCKSGFVSGN